MDFYKVAATIALSLSFLVGCGEKKLDLLDPKSLIEIVQNMPSDEQRGFEADMQLILSLRSDPLSIQGYTVKQVRDEANIARRFVLEENTKLLIPIIHEMESKGKTTAYFNVSSAGILSKPEAGDIPKTYTLDKLKALINIK